MSDASPQPAPAAGDLTVLLQRAEAGDTRAAGEILPLVYGELRKLAAARLAQESAAFTLQPTALVHEAWLRLGGDAQQPWRNRAHFFAAAAQAMRRILIENARRRQAVRHGGGLAKVSASTTHFDVAAPAMDDADLLRLDEALEGLAHHEPRMAELVQQWYFIGLSIDEIAGLHDVSPRTIDRELAYAKAWLAKEILRLRKVP